MVCDSIWRFSSGMLPLTAPVFLPSSGFGGAAMKSDGCRWRGTRLDLAIETISYGVGRMFNKMRRERLIMVTTLIIKNEGAVVVHTYPYV